MQSIERNYTLSNDALAMKVGDFIEYMNRDLTGLAPRGVTQTNIDDFETLGNAFEIFPPDAYYSAQVSAEVEGKNNARTVSYDKVQLISGFFEQKWGLKSWQYRQLDIKKMSSYSDDKFIARGRNVVAVATEQFDNLTAIGLTQTDIDNLVAELQIMDDKLHAIKLKQALRDSKSQERTQKGNELYGFLKQYSTIGKLVWENVDEAKYNDYIIYKTVHTGLSKPQNLTAMQNPLDPSVIDLSWDAVIGATSYDIFVNIADIGAPSGEFNLLNTTTGTAIGSPGVSDKRNYFKIKAKNAQKSSDYSNEVFIDLVIA